MSAQPHAHTPGPWQAEHSTSGGHDLYAFVAPNRSALGHFAGYLEQTNEDRWLGTGPNAANARLIAAAPDMLEALEEVMDELDVEGLPCPLCGRPSTIGHRHNCIWHVVEAAVRKARGKE